MGALMVLVALFWLVRGSGLTRGGHIGWSPEREERRRALPPPREIRRRHGDDEGMAFFDLPDPYRPRRRRKGTRTRRPKKEPPIEGEWRDIMVGELPGPQALILRNPTPEIAEALAARPPRERAALSRALALSQAFHGTPSEVVELEPHERRLGKYAVVAGSLEDFSYKPSPDSKRGDTIWNHRSGDRGDSQPESPNQPLVVVDPVTRRPAIIAQKSPMKFSSKRGFVG